MKSVQKIDNKDIEIEIVTAKALQLKRHVNSTPENTLAISLRHMLQAVCKEVQFLLLPFHRFHILL